jgi:xanthine dehydrogenase iron-sulfur cluster and FAD-binding subunit A
MELRKKYPLAVIINGSTDIALLQTKKKQLIPEILDLSGIDSLRQIREEKEGYDIGAGVTMEQLKEFSRNRLPVIDTMLRLFGSLQIRNLATIGGNVGSASPIGDILPILFSLGARIRLNNLSAERILPIDQFITGYRKTGLHADELITSILIPASAGDRITKYYKISKRKDLDISTVSGAFSLKMKGNKVEEISLAFGGMSEMTKKAVKTEAFLKGKEWRRDRVEEAMLILEKEFSPISDARAEKEFRSTAAKNLLLKFYSEMDVVS